MQCAKRTRKRELKRHAYRVKKQDLKQRIQELRKETQSSLKLTYAVLIIINLYQLRRADKFVSDIRRNPNYEPAEKLSFEERQYIYLWFNEGKNKSEIARRLKRHKSTISREFKRNWHALQKYRYHPYDAARFAQDLTDRRNSAKRQKLRINDFQIRERIDELVKEGIAPELISGRLLLELGKTVSHETIYQYIYFENRDLIKFLPNGGKKYHKRKSEKRSRQLRQPATPKTSIDKRPKAANDRLEFGHWEFDTIVSKQSSECLLVIQERVSRYFFVVKLKSCTAKEVSNAIISCLKPLGSEWLRSLTCDNGPENWCQDELKAAFGIEVYYCHPYCSSERGGVENRNGTLRRYYPKKTNFSLVSTEHLEATRQKLLRKPMKCLQYYSPLEIFTGVYQPMCQKTA